MSSRLSERGGPWHQMRTLSSLAERGSRENVMSYEASTPTVLIAGAGPTGLTLAYELLRRGVKPRLIDKTSSASRSPKALGVMARTLELLAPAGITKAMLAQGVQVPTFGIWSSGRRPPNFTSAEGLRTPYPLSSCSRSIRSRLFWPNTLFAWAA